MSRSTKRSTKQQGPTINDFFSQSRVSGSVQPGKILGDEAPSTTSRAKRALFSSKVELSIIEVQNVTPPVHTENAEVKYLPAYALFNPKKATKVENEIKTEPAKEEVKEKPIVPIVSSIIPTEAQIAATPTKTNKLRTSADLQAELARKGAARLHEQAAARDHEQNAARVVFLKSPTKRVQTSITEASPSKRVKKDSKKESKKRGPVKVLPVPSYVLPTPQKQQENARDEDRDTSPVEDSVRSAPKGYGSSLMNEEVKRAADVPLPTAYTDLYKAFNACETIVCLFDSSGKTLTFSALSQGVKRNTRKDFSFDRFAQILAVYPQAYDVKVKKVTCVGDRMGGVRSARWEHVIKPNLDYDLISFVTDPSLLDETQPSEPVLTSSPRKNLFSPMKGRPITSSSGIRIPSSPRKPSSPVKPLQREAVMDSRKRLKGWRITCRQQVFRCLLARRVLAAYEAFNQQHNLTLPATSSSRPIFFNREFATKIDSLCLPIEKAMIEQIPEEENAAGSSHQGMSEFLKIASDTVSTLPKGVEAALIELRSPQKKLLSSRGVPLSPAKFAEAPKPMSLLEKIKAKAALKAAAEMRRNPELEKKTADLVRLIDDRILFLIFDIYRANSKTSIKLSEMEDKMVISGKISRDKISSLLQRLTSLVPSHFSIGKTSIGEFIKVTDNSPSASEKVESALKKELESCKTQVTI